MLPQSADKLPADDEIAAFAGDVFKEFTKSAFADGSILSRGKSKAFLGELRRLGFKGAVDVAITGLATCRYGCIKHRAQCLQLGLAFLD
jgi:hypothetical protein